MNKRISIDKNLCKPKRERDEAKPILQIDSNATYLSEHSLQKLNESFFFNASDILFSTTLDDQLICFNLLFSAAFGGDEEVDQTKISIETFFKECHKFNEIKNRTLLQGVVLNQREGFKSITNTPFTGLVTCRACNVSSQMVLNWSIRDITQYDEVEASLLAKSEELLKVKSNFEKFLYGASHDLRSPISSILGLANLMRLENRDTLLSSYIEKIENSASKMDKIVRDLMGFTKATYQRPCTADIDLKEMSWNIVNRYRVFEFTKTITFSIKDNGNALIHSNLNHIEIIFDNIIRNAIQFYDANKVKSFLNISIKIHPLEAEIEFFDNGIGIGAKHQSLIFNVFYKASHQSIGAGLGLYMVKESVQQLNGSITLESEIGFGSVFRLKIPNYPKPLSS